MVSFFNEDPTWFRTREDFQIPTDLNSSPTRLLLHRSLES